MDFETKIGTTFLDYSGNPVYNWYHEKSHVGSLRKLLPESKNSNVLDLGCAGGTYNSLLRSKNYKQIFGLDLSLSRLQQAREKGYAVINSKAESLPFASDSIDSVICIDMLVHVLERKKREEMFCEVYRILRENGVFIFSIPSQKAYVYGDYGVTKEIIFSNSDGRINDYCCLINFDEIKNYSEKCNFAIEEIIGTQMDLKLFRPIKRLLKEKLYYRHFLTTLDILAGRTFLKPYGKAVFFKFRKQRNNKA
jgi:SAM-dependent methyltransferase